MARAAVKPGGDLEITIGIPMSSKWEALKVTDAAGLTLEFDVYRKGWRDAQVAEED